MRSLSHWITLLTRTLGPIGFLFLTCSVCLGQKSKTPRQPPPPRVSVQPGGTSVTSSEGDLIILGAPAENLHPVQFFEMPPAQMTWWEWWEASRDRFLRPIHQSQGDLTGEKQISALELKNAARSLSVLLESSDSKVTSARLANKLKKSNAAPVRSAVLLAIARLGQPDALDIIIDRAHNDEDIDVRRTAVLALGVLGNSKAEELLLRDQQLTNEENDVVVAALGLIKRPAAGLIEKLQKTVTKMRPDVGSVASWGLNSRPDPVTQRIFHSILSGNTNIWLASDALLSLGNSGDEKEVPFLADFLLEGPAVKRVAAYRELAREFGLLIADQNRIVESTKDYGTSYSLFSPEVTAELEKERQDTLAGKRTSMVIIPGFRNGLVAKTVPRGDPKYRIQLSKHVSTMKPWSFTVTYDALSHAAQLRGSAAMALGRFNSSDSRKALLMSLDLPNTYYSDYFKGPAILSLGRVGDAEAAAALHDLLTAEGAGQAYAESALRGYAAIALGLYVRRGSVIGEEVQHEKEKQTAEETPVAQRANKPAEKTGFAKGGSRGKPKVTEEEARAAAFTTLSECLLETTLRVDARSACAMGLGLTQRKEALQPLRALESVIRRDGEHGLLGNSLLARALLGDTTIMPTAEKLLASLSEDRQPEALIGQRAAIMALGLLDSPDAIPILMKASHANQFAAREVVLALSLSRSTQAGDILLKQLKEATDPAEQSYLALCIGEFYAPERTSPLGRFVSDTNYMMRNENLLPYQALVDEFLFAYLQTQFGERWQ